MYFKELGRIHAVQKNGMTCLERRHFVKRINLPVLKWIALRLTNGKRML